jgi:uncharacterized membrane protein HdeD (DUF308 family)
MKILGAALLIGLALFLRFGDGEGIVIPFIGAIIIIAAIVRLVPFVRTQKDDTVKTINIIEMVVDIGIGLALILITLLTDNGLGNWFGYLIGAFLIIRGAVHFYGTSEHKEESDMILYSFHILALIVGTYVVMTGDFSPAVLINIILVLSILAGGYLTYDGFTGYKSYRYQKTLQMPDYDHAKDAPAEKRVPVHVPEEEEDEEQDHIVA